MGIRHPFGLLRPRASTTLRTSSVQVAQGKWVLGIGDESLILVNESLNSVNESLILVNESLILMNQSLILVDESLILVNESLNSVNESLNSTPVPHTQYFDLPRLTSTKLSTSRYLGFARHKSAQVREYKCPMPNVQDRHR
ncbi:MAG: hypothetical protein V7L20_23955 [Nostoc sp.]|uniref:hypothetical protein n=1 Tax=Nostoc sp. TaxID=1180 RepID=UPI002FF55942